MSDLLRKRIDTGRAEIFLLELLTVSLPFSFEVSISDSSRLFFPTEPLMVALLLVVAAGLLLRRGSASAFITKDSRIVIPFAAALILGTLFSTQIGVSLKFTAINLLYITVFFLILHRHLVTRPNLFQHLVLLYTAGFIAISLLAVYRYSQMGWNPAVVKALFRPFYKDHTIFGATAAMLTAFWLSYPRSGKFLTPVLLQWVTGILLAGAVFMSYSRAAILSLLVFVLVRLLFYLKVRPWQIGSVAMLLLLYLFINRGTVSDRINANRHDSGNRQSDLVDHTLSVTNINTDVSNRERLNRWTSGISMFAARPVTGFGPGTYQFAYIPFQNPEYMTRLSVTDPGHIPENSGGTAHSEYILSMSETGIPGIAAWLVMLASIAAMAFRAAAAKVQNRMVIAGVATLSTYIFHAFFNNFLNTDKFAFLFWGILAWTGIHSLKQLKDEQ